MNLQLRKCALLLEITSVNSAPAGSIVRRGVHSQAAGKLRARPRPGAVPLHLLPETVSTPHVHKLVYTADSSA